MTTQTGQEAIEKQTLLNIEIGFEVTKLLNLKFGKDHRVKTSWGTKSIEGLGACITRIVEEQTEKLK